MTARDRRVAIVVVVLLALLGFWMLVLKPRSKDVKALDGQIVVQQQRLDAAVAQQARARVAQKNFESDYATVAKLGQAVPADDDVPSLVYQLDATAKRSNVDFRSLKLSAQISGAPAPQAQAQGAAGATTQPGSTTQQSGSTTQQSGSTTQQPTPAAAPPPQALAAATLPPGASIGPAGFPTMPFTFVFEGSYLDLAGFLGRIQDFTTVRGKRIIVRGRLLSVSGFQLQPGRKGFPQIKAIVAATAFLVPPGQGLTAGATPAGPTKATVNP